MFKEIILKRFELEHDLDIAMVNKAYRNQGPFKKTYVVHDPDNGQEGTDLFPEDCDEDDLDNKVDTSQGFTPHEPLLMATGDYFEENPDDTDAYKEVEICEVCYLKVFGDECCEDDPSDIESNADSEG